MVGRGALTLAAGAAAAWTVRHRLSPAVRAWEPGAGRRIRAGPLQVRIIDADTRRMDGGTTTVLLHGLTGSGDSYGAGLDALAEAGLVVIPDLLGFGRSMDLARSDFSREAHLKALDDMVAELGISGDITLVGHSMGSALAVHWAARQASVKRLVLFCAPLYRDREEAVAHIRQLGLMEALFAMETPWARWTCWLMCKYRRQAAWAAVVHAPQWPVLLARQGVLHSWPSYLGGMNDIILQGGWEDILPTLAERGVQIVFADGRNDPVPVAGRHAQFAQRFASVTRVVHPVGSHDLPIAYPGWSRKVISAG